MSDTIGTKYDPARAVLMDRRDTLTGQFGIGGIEEDIIRCEKIIAESRVKLAQHEREVAAIDSALERLRV